MTNQQPINNQFLVIINLAARWLPVGPKRNSAQ